MAIGDDRSENDASGIRRRLSHPRENEGVAFPTDADVELESYTLPSSGNTTSTADDSSEIAIPFASARESDVASPISATGVSRVRFSTDFERDYGVRSQVDGPGEHTQTNAGSLSSRQHPTTPNLTIDTGRSEPTPGSGLPQYGSVSSSSTIRSPTSPRNRQYRSPISPQARNRGYSLRTSIFQRNIKEAPQSPGSIELQESGPSTTHNQTISPIKRPTSKKSVDTTVTVSPVVPDSDAPFKLQQEKGTGVQGISALPHYHSWVESKARKSVLISRVRAFYRRARKTILRINDISPTKDGRHIDLNTSHEHPLIDERTSKPYIGNTIRSSRYSAWNFLPRQLFAQFSKLANFYFLCVSILQMIPGLSTTGTYTTIVPLLFFVSLSIAKEGYDDLRRYRLDKEENNRDATVMRTHRYGRSSTSELKGPSASSSALSSETIDWVTVKWKEVKVGDVIRLRRNEAAPADLVLLRSTGLNGAAYVETMALDGETNLKTKQTTTSMSKVCTSWESTAKCGAHFVVEDPNINLYNFEGKLTLNGETSPLTNTEIIYRGSVLRNTPEAVGMVIYSGEECKIRMNANKNPRIKAPALQSIVNRIVIVIVIFVIALAIFNTVAYQIWRPNVEAKAWYLEDARVAFFPILASFIIMFNTMIPLSLYVSLEIVKVFQMVLLNDIDMYDEASNTPMEARTSTINEELGQVSYIFSDKTGTLTDNSMKFRKVSVAGTAWLHDLDLKGEPEKERLLHKKRSKGKKSARKSRISGFSEGLRKSSVSKTNGDASRDSSDEQEISKWKSSARPAKSQPEMRTVQMIRYIQRKPYTVFARKARLLLLSIALCHTCLPEIQGDGSIDFQASSPDELALVRAAQELGYMVMNRDTQTLTLRSFPAGQEIEPVEETYEILDVIEFSSKRKRMSVIVRFPDQRICMFCKGADSVVMQRLKLAAYANEKVVEIERRANKRKSIEAQVALQRKSEQQDRKNSLQRNSFALGRASFGPTRRSSTNTHRLEPIRDELDEWLRQRENDVDVSSVEDDSIYYSPRPSAQFGRQSLAYSEVRSSMYEEEELVDESLVVDEPLVIERCFQHINDFATEGLRTLLYGYRFIDEADYQSWKKIYLDATTSLVNRTELIENAGELLERDLELAGATAIEDKLQKGVPETIDKLRRANIKMWMLTGDKRETAINIGHSCRLIKDYSTVTVLDHEIGEVEQHIAAAVLGINDNSVAHSVVVVDGQTLAMIEGDSSLQALFFELAILADSVICCRASPSQKAGLVKSIRKKVKKSITLAIGDGANDIAMIQEAHVGIGITGKEGLQAARTSDYSIAQFRFLLKLLLVHGRWNYIRTCKYTVGTFWKEMLFYLTQALYQRWAGYTGTSLYESWSLSMFNTLFTSLPVIFMGIFEKDLAASTLLAVPELYMKGQRNGGFNFKIYLAWMFMASSEAMIVFFCMLRLYGQMSFTNDQAVFALGVLTYSAVIIMVSTKLQILEMHNKSIVAAISFVLSVGGWFLWNILLSTAYANNVIYNVKDGIIHRFGRNITWWLVLILTLASLVAFELIITAFRAAFFTTDVDVFQELEHDTQAKKRFEEAAAMELQQGWDRGEKKTSTEIRRQEEMQAEERKRSLDVRQILANRPVELEERPRNDESPQRPVIGNELDPEVNDMLSRGFGSVRK